MLPLVLIYLALVALFGVTGIFTWILRGRGFSDFRRSAKPTPPADAGPGERTQP